MKDLKPPLNVPLALIRETITNCWLKIISKTDQRSVLIAVVTDNTDR